MDKFLVLDLVSQVLGRGNQVLGFEAKFLEIALNVNQLQHGHCILMLVYYFIKSIIDILQYLQHINALDFNPTAMTVENVCHMLQYTQLHPLFKCIFCTPATSA